MYISVYFLALESQHAPSYYLASLCYKSQEPPVPPQRKYILQSKLLVVNIFKGHLQCLEDTAPAALPGPSQPCVRAHMANGICCIMCQKLRRLVSISAEGQRSATAS